MMKTIVKRLLIIAILLIAQISMAAPAYRGLVKLIQPNGDTISAYLYGDEVVNWVESEDNYTLLYNSVGYLEYAIKDSNGDIIPSGIIAKEQNKRSIADLNFLSSIDRKLKYSKAQLKTLREINANIDNTKASAVEGLTKGVRKFLVILVQYPDVPFHFTKQHFENLFNQVGYSYESATGSIRDYFLDNSYGQFDIQFKILGPYTLPQNQAFYGEPVYSPTDPNQILRSDKNADQMIKDACYAADSDIDFSSFDNDGNLTVDGIHIIYSGRGQHNGGGVNAIWAHRGWLSPELILDGVKIINYSCACEQRGYHLISGIGVHTHEIGHVLGLLDYYDTDYGQSGGTSRTFSEFDVMDAGAYNNHEKTPPLYNAYSKTFLGWVEPYVIDTNMLMDITSIPSSDTALVFRINTPTQGEYFLLENINFSGWNGYMHQSIRNYKQYQGVNSGIMAIHVDESVNSTGWGTNKININPNRNEVLFMTADGTYNGVEDNSQVGGPYSGSWYYTDVANMLYPGKTNITSLTDATTTNLKSWSNQNSGVAIANITRLANDNITFKTNGGAALGVQTHTLAAEQITHTSAKLKGSTAASISGDATIIERGFVISTNRYPRISDTKLVVSGTQNDFDIIANNLNKGTRYYYRAYGINANGVSYGEHLSFITTSDPITNNAILDSNFAACITGETPTIIGTDPQGGSGTYIYRWFESIDNLNWIPTQNAGILKDYTPSKLTVPTYFKRVVLSAEKSDTSSVKLVPIVSETIAGTISAEKDSIAPNNSTGNITLTNNVGDVILWQRKKDGGNFVAIPNSAGITIFSEILTQEGTYQYRVRVRNGACPQKQTPHISLVVSSLIGLFNIESDAVKFDIYPNPSNGTFTLNLNTFEKDGLNFEIINILGKKVYNKDIISSNKDIILQNLDSGTYFFVLKNKDKIMGTKQLIIRK